MHLGQTRPTHMQNYYNIHAHIYIYIMLRRIDKIFYILDGIYKNHKMPINSINSL